MAEFLNHSLFMRDRAIKLPGVALWLFCLVSSLSSTARAHDPGLSTTTITVLQDRIEARLTLAPPDVVAIGSARAEAGKNTSELRAGDLEAMAREALEVIVSGTRVEPEHVDVHTDDQLNVHFELAFHPEKPGPVVFRFSLLEFLPREHRQFVSVENKDGQILQERMLKGWNDSLAIDITTPVTAAAARSKHNSRVDFMALGVHHILTGYDHLFFLFALLVVSRGFWSTARIITMFTVAHSLTLALAALGLVQVPSRIVEPLIAASIVYVGIENLLRRGEPGRREWLTFSFGLVHGLGFAGVLREMGIGAGGTGIAMPLFTFNFGVELGQIAVAAVVLPLIWWLRRQPRFAAGLVPVCSSLVSLAGGLWLLERLFHLDLMPV